MREARSISQRDWVSRRPQRQSLLQRKWPVCATCPFSSSTIMPPTGRYWTRCSNIGRCRRNWPRAGQEGLRRARTGRFRRDALSTGPSRRANAGDGWIYVGRAHQAKPETCRGNHHDADFGRTARRCRSLPGTGDCRLPHQTDPAVRTPGGHPGGPGEISHCRYPRAVITRHTLREDRRKVQILLVEDNAVNQQLAVRLLEKRGHIVTVASKRQRGAGIVDAHKV